MKTKLRLVMFVAMLAAVTQIYAQNGVGINNDSPSDTLDVLGTAKISRYLKVGNPTAPATQSLDNYKIYDLLPDAGWAGADVLQPCGTNSWGLLVGGTVKNYFQFTGTTTSRSFSRLLTAWFWIPSNSTFPYVDLEWSLSSQDPGYDGMYLEYTLDGITFTKLTPIGGVAYSTTAFNATGGANPAGCAAPNPTTNHWGVNAATRSEFLLTGLTGKWVRLSIAATNDLVTPHAIMRVFGLSVDCAPASTTLNNTFQTGSIYASGNVYAGSNVLMGDMAEYFKIDGKVEPGDLVSLNTELPDSYFKTKTRNDANVIGIVSTAPTITLNSPKGSPVALAGRVPVKVTTENGPIKIGDYLTASSLPGYAMKANPGDFCVGKALEPFNGKGERILCLIQNGWFNNTIGTKQITVSSSPKTKKVSADTNIKKDAASEKAMKFIPLQQATEKSMQVPPTPSDPTKFWNWDGEKITEFIPTLKQSTE